MAKTTRVFRCATQSAQMARASARNINGESRASGTGCVQRPQAYAAYAAEGSVEQFITEHYWGYSAQRDGGCVEYHVSHVPWRVWRSATAAFEGDAESLYGSELGRVLRRAPDSAFIADGSPVRVFTGRRIA